eukprot:8451607-Lingulodinium_polyedra.AAC.1
MLLKAVDRYPVLEHWIDKYAAILFDPGGLAEHIAELAMTDLDDREAVLDRAEYLLAHVKAPRRANLLRQRLMWRPMRRRCEIGLIYGPGGEAPPSQAESAANLTEHWSQ